MKEIGGYIELEYFHGNEYHQNAIALNCGRNCLAYLIKLHSIQKIFLPYFLCASVSNVCKKYSVEIVYYHINEDFSPIIPTNFSKSDWFYFVNYYGQFSNEQIKTLCSNVENLIVDNAQAFFQLPIENIPTIYTCRKYFGVSDGAYLLNSKEINEELVQDYSYDRMHFLLGRLEKTANEFYSEYSDNNKKFVDEDIKLMSKLTHNLLRGIDYQFVMQRRKENANFLNEQLKIVNKNIVKINTGAFAYPLYISDGSIIRKKLQEKKIYIPTLWPDVFEICDENILEYKLAKDILPIPVDQRYCCEDMESIVTNIRSIL